MDTLRMWTAIVEAWLLTPSSKPYQPFVPLLATRLFDKNQKPAYTFVLSFTNTRFLVALFSYLLIITITKPCHYAYK